MFSSATRPARLFYRYARPLQRHDIQRTSLRLQSQIHSTRPRVKFETHNAATQSKQRRSASNWSTSGVLQAIYRDGKGSWNNLKWVWRKHPFQITLAIGIIGVGVCGVIYVNWFYWKYAWMPTYPEPVAKQLRKALYFSNFDFQPVEAVKYLKEALLAARDNGMDAWCDEVIGIKMDIVYTMERVEQYREAILALEVIRQEGFQRVKLYEENGGFKKDRTRLLTWLVRMTLKLGELYSRPEVWDRDAAEERLSWAVEIMMKETERRTRLGITDAQEGPWMTREQMGASLEALATAYDQKDQQYLSAPLYLHAINQRTVVDCHTVVLMNNLASSLAQQTPRAASAVQKVIDGEAIEQSSSKVPVSRDMLLDMAQTWAQNAIDQAGQIGPPVRDEQCDMGCVAAIYNLGEIAEMRKKFDEAIRRYEEALSLARAIGFEDGVEQTSARLRKLKQNG